MVGHIRDRQSSVSIGNNRDRTIGLKVDVNLPRALAVDFQSKAVTAINLGAPVFTTTLRPPESSSLHSTFGLVEIDRECYDGRRGAAIRVIWVPAGSGDLVGLRPLNMPRLTKRSPRRTAAKAGKSSVPACCFRT